LLTLATQLAGKVPLMVNWTVGPRHLESVSKLSNVKTILTSWAFIDRLESVDFNGIEGNLFMLEDLRSKISIKAKIRATLLAKRSTKAILEHFQIDKPSEDSKAVPLFTTGTESMPKGVPLTHKNILTNQKGVLEGVPIYSD